MNTRCVVVGTAFIAYGYYIMSAYGVRTGKGCKEALSNSFAVQLQCSNGEWIHVEHEAYGDGDGDVDGDAATCRLKSAAVCSTLITSSQNGLIVNCTCNGKQSCFEAMTVQTISNCNVTDPAAEVKYKCIKGSMNMCSPVTTTVNGSMYLHSPGFPDSVGVNSSCVVKITGQNVEVTLVEQRMRSGMLNISGDGRQLWTNVNVAQYNRVLPEPAAEILIVYDNHDQDGSNVWIRVAGQINITISGEMLDASTTTTSTQRLPSSQRTSGPGTSDTSTQTPKTAQLTTIASSETVTSTRGHTTHTAENIATRLPSKSTTAVSNTVSATETDNSGDVVLALSVVCGMLVLIIAGLVIYFMVVKPLRKKHNTSSNTGTPSAHGVTNVYDGIQRNTSDVGDEHNYGHITSSGGSFYVNSYSGDDPYVNT
ncbi:uncharacterized protein [Haliotis asinina]|uniref:uncharacterized protein n=1 Tax=Haliotis asinina TaxID=109174 RepID=UPI003531FD9D